MCIMRCPLTGKELQCKFVIVDEKSNTHRTVSVKSEIADKGLKVLVRFYAMQSLTLLSVMLLNKEGKHLHSTPIQPQVAMLSGDTLNLTIDLDLPDKLIGLCKCGNYLYTDLGCFVC